jgi:4-alpha-glucanotransferase
MREAYVSLATCQFTWLCIVPTFGRSRLCLNSTLKVGRPSSPVCRRITSAPLDSAGETRCIAGQRTAPTATFGGSPVVRIDHFRGFAAYWEIPASEPTAIGGRWVAGPGKELFAALRDSFPELPVIAEDLGSITPDVEDLRDSFNLPGMRILQFAFAENASHAYLPHNFQVNTVAYAGTHDNDTSIGWWNSASVRERAFAQHYLGTDGSSIQWGLIRALSSSVARLVVYPMQDVLGLDGRYRMNVPGVPDGNWEWRFSWPEVQSWQAKVLREIGAVHGRSNLGGAALPG